MADNQELADVVRDIVDRHVQANTQVAETFTATFGDSTDSATQWLTYQLTNSETEIAQILAAAAPEAAEAPEAADPVDAMVQEALATVPGAEALTQEEIDSIVLEVLAEE